MKRTVHILDCTIRDGSYLINYQFTTEDTFFVAASLCAAGVERIEVGHGLGLDAQYKGKGEAAQSDVEYVQAAVSAVNGKAGIGVFFIPGIGTLDSIRAAAEAGLGFIRVGTNIDQFTEAEQAIRLGKQLGLEVWSNLMKSYVVSPDEFGRTARRVADYGADVVVLVDSAGGLTPQRVRDYAAAGLSNVDVPLGFHGHNNLQLVVANCLAFVEQGGRFVDGSLRGMGRSAGNAATELISALLDREGYDIGSVDWEQLISLGHRLVAPNVPRDIGLLPDEIASGVKLFHSGFQPAIDRSSARAGVESFRTILRLDEAAKKQVTETMADHAASKVLRRRPKTTAIPIDDRWLHREGCDTLDELKAELRVLSAKSGHPPVMTLARPRAAKGGLRIAPVRLGAGYCIGHVEVPAGGEREVLGHFHEDVSLWMADGRIVRPATLPDGILWLEYDDDALIVTALQDWLQVHGCRDSIYIPDVDDPLVDRVRLTIGETGPPPCSVGLAMSRVARFTVAEAEQIRSGGKLLVAQPDAVAVEAIAAARARGLEIWRLDLGQALLAEVSRVFGTVVRLRDHSGRLAVDGVTVVAGGVLGKEGELVVDSISVPTTILGQADGLGGIKPLKAVDEDVKRLVVGWMLSRAGF